VTKIRAGDGTVSAEIFSRYLVNDTNIQFYTRIYLENKVIIAI